MEEIPLYAAVRFYSDEMHHIHFIDANDIKKFESVENFNFTIPHYVKKVDGITGENEYTPAQVLRISDNLESLKNSNELYKFKKKRHSEALHQCQQSELNQNTRETKEQNDTQISTGHSKIKKKQGKKNLTQEEKNLKQKVEMKKTEDNTKIVEEHLKVLSDKELDYGEKSNVTKESSNMDFEQMCNDLTAQLESKIKRMYEEKFNKQEECIQELKVALHGYQNDFEHLQNINENLLRNEVNHVKKNLFRADLSTCSDTNNSNQGTRNIETVDGNEKDPVEDPLKDKSSNFKKINDGEIFNPIIEDNAIPSTSTGIKGHNFSHLRKHQLRSSSDDSHDEETGRKKKQSKKKRKRTSESDKQYSSNGNEKKKSISKKNYTEERENKSTKKLGKKDKDRNKDKMSLDGEIETPKRKRSSNSFLKLSMSKDPSSDKENSSDEGKSKKEKKQKKRKLKSARKSDNEYLSDNFDKSEHQDYTQWIKEKKNKKVRMMHLKHGVSITYEAWNDLKMTHHMSKYLRKLAKAIWTTHVLMNRAILINKSKTRLQNRSPRKELTPVKKAVFRKVYFQHIDMIVRAKKMRKSLKKSWKSHLGTYINSLIENEKRRLQEGNNSDDSSTANSSETNSSDSSSE